jgi:raffinose/stachyose/melibiose transport system substrate-binding protein
LWSCARRDGRTPIRVLHIETNKQVLACWQQAAREFEARFPQCRVEFRVLESATFRARLPTLLQSPEGPHIFYSWGGALIDVQRGAELLEDITAHLPQSLLVEYMPQALAAYRRDGRYFGMPYLATEIGLLCNLELVRQHGASPADCRTWEGFLGVVRHLRERSVVPLSAGGMDRWPLALIHSHLALRCGGTVELRRVLEGPPGSFVSPDYLRATNAYLGLISMNPFQPGVLASKAQTALAAFVSGQAAFLMHGSWFYRQAGALRPELEKELFSRFPLIGFPRVANGVGNDQMTQSQLNGWLVRRGAPDAAIEFLKHFTSRQSQRRLAERSLIIPAHLEAQESIAAPALRDIAGRLSQMRALQLEWTTLLGPNGGAAAADAAAALTGGTMNAPQALALIDRGWRIDQENMVSTRVRNAK